jgi:hypothetical protein
VELLNYQIVFGLNKVLNISIFNALHASHDYVVRLTSASRRAQRAMLAVTSQDTRSALKIDKKKLL